MAKNYVVYGLGVSGISILNYLSKNNFQLVATDDNQRIIDNFKLRYPNINFVNPKEINCNQDSVISFAPGIPLYFPKNHQILKTCEITHAKLSCDIEIFYDFNNSNNNVFIGITGTNGKSTTTALTYFIFKELNIDSAMGGNIGVPCFDLPQNQKNFSYIFETSSFQLDLINKVNFNISALLNITPDHIDRHGSMQGYINAKKRIFLNQKQHDFAIIDYDNENSRSVYNELKNDGNFKANLIPVSTTKFLNNGISIINGVLTNNIENKSSQFALDSKFLKGDHNNQNMAFAFAICYCYFLQKKLKLNVDFPNEIEKKIIDKIKNFQGLKHRMQIVREIGNKRFINDSKATNAESTINALKVYGNVFWILGGRAKEGGITILKPYFKKIVKAYLIGEASDNFAEILKLNNVNYEKCFSLENAFKKIIEDIKKFELSEKNILLSPACASLDQWKSFEERGDYFCRLVNDLSN
jgi:UDP-N-acetylmuramoylalanine--D-glutamate ligase